MTIGSLHRIGKPPPKRVVKYSPKVYLRSCDRCSGDVEFGWDLFSLANVATCLMCGAVRIGKVVKA